MSVQVSYKKQIALGVMLLLTLFVSIEIFAQIYDYFLVTDCIFTNSDAVKHLEISLRRQICEDHNSLQYHNNETHTQFVPNQHFPTVNINDHGFRGPEFTDTKPDNTYRIFFLGGSTAFGSGATSDSTTISGYLQHLYDKQNLPFDVEVINAGIPGVTSYTEQWLVKTKLLEFEPDLLIIYDGWNDAGKHLDNPGLTPTQYFKMKNNQTIIQKNDESNNFLLKVYNSIKTKNLIHQVISDSRYSLGIYEKSIHDQTSAKLKSSVWEKRWSEICDLGQTNQFDVIVTLQPITGSGNSTMSDFAKKRYDLNNNEWILNQMEHYATSLNDLDSCTATKDLRHVFDNTTRPIFLDAGHLNNFGNKIIAKHLFEISYPLVENFTKSG